MEIAKLVDMFQAAKDAVDQLEAELREAKHDRDAIKEELINAMLEEETDSIGRNGRKYSLQAKTKYSKAAGMEAELFGLLREQGLGDIIQETVNANTLSATMKAMAEENDGVLPEEYADCINTYEYTDISVRRG